MKINHILFTIFCFIIINSGIVFSERPTNLTESEKLKIEKLISPGPIATIVPKSSSEEMDFADSLYIFTPEDKIEAA